MFLIPYTFDFGVLGSYEASIIGVVEKDGLHYGASVKRAMVSVFGVKGLLDVAPILSEAELVRVEQRLINKYIAAEAKNELLPEDWARDTSLEGI